MAHPLKDEVEDIIALMREMIALLQAILNQGGNTAPLAIRGLQLADLPRQKVSLTVDLGNKFFDLVGGIHVVVQANGVLDAPLSVTTDQPDFVIANQVNGDTTVEFDCLFPLHDVMAYAITVTAPADNPTTPDLESVSLVLTGTLSHSKATELTASVTDLPR